MGLFSTIGGLIPGLGPIGGALGGVVDGLFSANEERKTVKRQNQLEMDKYVRLRQASEKGGFHPLETLRAGGNVQATAAPRLMSSLVAGNAFDALENELTGEGAKQRRRAEVDDEIRERQLEQLKYDLAQQQITKPTVGGNRPPRLPSNSRPKNPNYPGKVVSGDGPSVMSGGPRQPVYIDDGFMTPSGGKREIDETPRMDITPSTMTKGDDSVINMPPEFPGVDEMAGWAISAGPQRWARQNPQANETLRRGSEAYVDGGQRYTYWNPLISGFINAIDETYETFGKGKKK